MTARPILTAPDPRLKAISTDVKKVDGDIRKLAQDMADSMYAADGIGLAAVQIGVPQRVIVMDLNQKEEDGKPAKKVGGYTGDQRFFLGFGQVWRTKFRDAALLNQITNNEHTPGHYRPQVVRNLDTWYDAFGVKEGEKLYLAPADRIKVW